MNESSGPLAGVNVLDLTRILAGPSCTQLLGDLGASILKIENPATKGDDTRTWGPPFVQSTDDRATDISSYFAAANRNKRSVAVDFTTRSGQETIRRLARQADILVENYRPGGLIKYGLNYDSLAIEFPHLIYCSISGFGQTGPNCGKPGYDLLAQGFGGIMSLTGEPDGPPMKVGVGIADVMCGMYACVGILAALRHREQTGEGQMIDLALVDTQVAWLVNEGVNYLTSRKVPKRLGNAHPNITPYEIFETCDGHVIVAVGNDNQFRRFCNAIECPELADEPRYATNPNRLANRDTLIPIIQSVLKTKTKGAVITILEAADISVGPVLPLDEVFASSQVEERKMKIEMTSKDADIHLIGNPLKFSKTPITYRFPPPRFGADTDRILGSDQPFSEDSSKGGVKHNM
ncbi:MAG: CaiB/BaiF CoA-transferase family protein [Aestuariivita sp.]|nr:CaiB/BaiF CoA-transferase family protein [Aestuariivita sp.]